jgi:hypothetical protein
MAKSVIKIPVKSDKPAKESSTVFHKIIKASVKANPKPKKEIKKKTKPDDNKMSDHHIGMDGG